MMVSFVVVLVYFSRRVRIAVGDIPRPNDPAKPRMRHPACAHLLEGIDMTVVLGQ